MKKLMILSLVLLIVFMITGPAWAWHHRGFGVFIGPPVVLAPPVYYGGYYAPYSYYGPGYYYGPRVWIPGHWEQRWTPYGWQRFWLPGYWR